MNNIYEYTGQRLIFARETAEKEGWPTPEEIAERKAALRAGMTNRLGVIVVPPQKESLAPPRRRLSAESFRTCQVCERSFRPLSVNQKYCCRTCKRIANGKQKP